VRHDRNRGTAASRNTGVRAARTEWVALLDSDDEWLPHLVDVLWPRRDGHVLVSGCGISVGADRPRYRGAPWSRPHVLRSPEQAITPENPIVTSAVLLHRATVLALDGFAEDRRRSEDLDLWFRLLEVGTALVVPDVVCRYHHHAQQKTTALTDTRAQQQAILASYAGRPWHRPALLALDAAHRWDELRERPASRAGQLRGVLHAAGSPRRALALARLLGFRARVRRRTGAWTADGEPVGAVAARIRADRPAGPPGPPAGARPDHDGPRAPDGSPRRDDRPDHPEPDHDEEVRVVPG
jgi:hypothetical protein